MGTTGVSSSIASQRAAPWPRQIPLLNCCVNSSQNVLPYHQKLQMKLDTLPRLSYSVNHGRPTMRIKIFSFGAIESRFLDSEKGRLGLVSSRTAIVRAQKEDKENQELDKVEIKLTESWASSMQTANTASRIFMAAFVWISLFFGICITNSETGGGRPGRRGPRK